MRIIAGEFRGRRLLPPEGDVTRPITDRVKQSLFDILSPRIADAIVYDCFAGTGSMGLECLSRGARHATFFEADFRTARRLEQNIEALQVHRRATVATGDLFKRLTVAPSEARPVDLLFLDPPYRFLRERPDALTRLAGHLVQLHLKPDAVLVFRHDAGDRLELPGLERLDERTYGGMTLEFLRPANIPSVEG